MLPITAHLGNNSYQGRAGCAVCKMYILQTGLCTHSGFLSCLEGSIQLSRCRIASPASPGNYSLETSFTDAGQCLACGP